MASFDYSMAFSRNLGWVNPEEQKILQGKTIAIPGMGGVGGFHIVAFARLGIQNFKIADFDHFEIHNMNRQAGATMGNLNRKKTECMKEIVLEINPLAKVQTFDHGVNDQNYQEFLKDVDLLVDGIDIFEIDVKIKLFDLALKMGIPVITAGPLGMGTSHLCFHPKGIKFSQYFDLDLTLSKEDKIIRFISALAPNSLHAKYLYYPQFIDILAGKAPSLPMGVFASTSAIVSNAFKILLNRGEVLWAPRGMHYDFYLNTSKRFWVPFGNRNPLQRIKMYFIKKMLFKKKRE